MIFKKSSWDYFVNFNCKKGNRFIYENQIHIIFWILHLGIPGFEILDTNYNLFSIDRHNYKKYKFQDVKEI